MAYLIMRRGPQPGKVYELNDDETWIGRGSKNDIIIHDNEVSREHVHIVRMSQGYEVHDLDSSNGTFINGQIVEDKWLAHAPCIIELGDSITFELQRHHPDSDSETSSEAYIDPDAPQMYLVVTTSSQDEPALYPLNSVTTRVGRSTTCDVVIIEPEISREHFQLILGQQGYVIQDLGSTNGTRINNDPLTGQSIVTPADVIQVGQSIKFHLTDQPEIFADGIIAPPLIDTKELGESPTKMRNNVKPQPTAQVEIPPLAHRTSSDVGTGIEKEQLRNQVLITYAREDWGDIVAPMLDTLAHEDIDFWVDQYLAEGSSDWLLATEQARLECWMLVVVVSDAAMQSDLVRKNWRHFQNREKPIILLIYQPVDRMPIGANKLTRIQYNPGVPDVAFHQLVDEINTLKTYE